MARARFRMGWCRAACLLGVGAVMSYGIAWAAMMVRSPWREDALVAWPQDHAQAWLLAARRSKPGVLRTLYSQGVPERVLADRIVFRSRYDWKNEWSARRSGERAPAERFEPGAERISVVECGLPFRCVTSRVQYAAGAHAARMVLAEGLVWPTAADKPLPWHPVSAGLAMNSVFYAAMLHVLFAATASLGRALRRRRGLCTECGYSLAGLAPSACCPECGERRGDVTASANLKLAA